MAVSSAQVVVATSAVALNPAETDTVSGTTLVLKAVTADVALGASNVTMATGLVLTAGGTPVPVELGSGEQLYAICATSATVHVLRLGG